MQLATSQEFLALTNMEVSKYYILFIDGELPIVERDHFFYIDMR